MKVYISGKEVVVNPSKSIGKGGEADIFELSDKVALKLFKQPNHPDLIGFPEEQKAAQFRIEEHQTKLKEFPKRLPQHVITPQALATDRNGKIVGYTMEFLKGAELLLRYGDRAFRNGIPPETMLAILKSLWGTVRDIHPKVVIGDFNDLNVLVQGSEAYIIDADSFQFGKFLSRVFTEKFVDPLICDPTKTAPLQVKPHNPDSDWYAFAIILMNSLLFVGPYGGIYKPKNPAHRIPHGMRPLKRITVFHNEVQYPKPAIHYRVLPDDLLQHFHAVFEKNQRGIFPEHLLETLRWTTCTQCGTQHARAACPNCAFGAPSAIKEVVAVRGKVTATRIFKTPGVILYASLQGEKLRWLYHENGQFKRESGNTIIAGNLDPHMRFRIHGDMTLFGKDGRAVIMNPPASPTQLTVESYGSLPMFDANEYHWYWTQNGQLMRNDDLGPKYIGNVLSGQTLFWVGPSFGFGFYRAGNFSSAFVFDGKNRGIDDSIKLPRVRGQLFDATAVFAKERCWFFIALKESGKTIHRCFVINKNGSVEGSAEAEEGDGSWLGTLRGKCAAGSFLLSATDEGIARVDIDNGTVVPTKEFPDTEPFVDSGSHLFPDKNGIYVVNPKEITMLKLS